MGWLLMAMVLLSTPMKVELYLSNPSVELRQLVQQGLTDWVVVAPKEGRVHLFLDAEQVKILDQLGIPYTVLDADLSSTWDASRKMTFGYYYTFAELETRIQQIVNTYGPRNLVKDTIIGTSWEGRPIHALRVTDNVNVDEGEPAVLFTGVHHAREPIGATITVEYANWLLEHYDTDSTVRWLVDHREIWVVPVVNPDGYVYNESTGYPGWRKNKRDNDNNGVFDPNNDGVDLNRNYGYLWAYDNTGSSPDPTSNIYRGPAPFSEPETQAIRDLVNLIDPVFALNYHSYSNYLIFPYGHANGVFPPESTLYQAFSWEMTRTNGYTYGTGWELLYTVNGDSDDWMYGDTTGHPRTFAFTPEVGNDFWEAVNDTGIIVQQFNENLPMNLFVTKGADLFIEADQTQTTPSSGAIQTGDTVALSVHLRNLYFGGDFQGILFLRGQPGGCYIPMDTVSATVLAFPDPGTWSAPLHVVLTDTSSTPVKYTLPLQAETPGGFQQTVYVTVYKGVAMDTLLKESFETGLGAFQPGGGGGNWGIASPGYNSYYSLQDSPSGNYGNDSNTWVQTSINLTQYNSAILTFWHMYDFETKYDHGYVEISTNNGSTWNTLQTFTGRLPTWQKEVVDLSPFTGNNILLRFRVQSDFSITRDGWMIDGILVFGMSATNYSTPSCPTTPVVAPSPRPHPKASLHLTLTHHRIQLFGQTTHPVRLTLYNALGQPVWNRTLPTLQGSAPVALPRFLSAGVYWLRVQSGPLHLQRRLLVLP